jgi:type III pantothenate kinase
MNLAIDIGNSFSKLGIFDGSNKLMVTVVDKLSAELLSDLLDRYGVTDVIYSSVKGEHIIIEELSSSSLARIIPLSSRTSIPVKVNYLTPETLGTDRIAGIVGGYNKYANTNVLVIDAGTAVTFDLLTSEGIYEGGNISPGLSMRFRALNNYTNMLPLISSDNKYDIIGKDTENAIRSGVQQGLVFEINEYIRTFKNLYKGLKIIVTGGDGELLSGMIDQTADYSPDLVIEGLNFIANYNA